MDAQGGSFATTSSTTAAPAAPAANNNKGIAHILTDLRELMEIETRLDITSTRLFVWEKTSKKNS